MKNIAKIKRVPKRRTTADKRNREIRGSDKKCLKHRWKLQVSIIGFTEYDGFLEIEKRKSDKNVWR